MTTILTVLLLMLLALLIGSLREWAERRGWIE